MTKPAKTDKPHKSGKAELRALAAFLPFLWPRDDAPARRRVTLAITFLIAHKLINIGVPLIYGGMIDLVAQENFLFAALFGLIGAYAGARLLVLVFDELMHYVFARVAQQSIRRLALALFRHLHSLSLRFHLDRQTGGLSRIMERGTKSIELLLTFLLFRTLPTLLEILLTCTLFGFLFDWRYAAAAFITIAGYSVYTVVVTEWRIKFRRRMNEQDTRANTRAIDSLLNYETVKYFNAEDAEAQRYDNALRRYENAAVKARTSLSLLNIGQGGIIAIGTILLLSMAGADVAAGVMTIGLFASVNMYILQMYLPLSFLGTVYREIRRVLTDMEEMFSLLQEDADIKDAPAAPPLRAARGKIEFRNVGFSYGRKQVLDNVSFTVPGGCKCAIVGASGAGKSTIARLLYRFYDPQQGSILIDGQDLRACAQRSVRACIGVVPQDTVLFNDTLRYNIAYGNPSATDADLQRAAAAADIAAFIQTLPEGWHTMVGERGLKLSGGEKQRVAIARALLKAPAIYLFDEATSALDSRTERNIQTALNAISRRHTTLVIAHRLSTIIDADEILVLQDGKIAERGSHPALLKQNGLYAAMWQRQQTVDNDSRQTDETAPLPPSPTPQNAQPS